MLWEKAKMADREFLSGRKQCWSKPSFLHCVGRRILRIPLESEPLVQTETLKLKNKSGPSCFPERKGRARCWQGAFQELGTIRKVPGNW